MAKEICISSTPHETRLAIIEDDELAEIYYERENEYTLAGSIYKGRVTRVLPGMQSAFVDIGLERDAFLYVTDFLEEQGDVADFERVSTRRPQARQRTLSSQSSETAEETGEEPARAEESGEKEEQGGTRRWRGRRGRRRGGRLRSGVARSESSQDKGETGDAEQSSGGRGREEAGAQEPRARRTAQDAEPEPFVLPGETLSKYGGTPQADSEPESVKAAPQPQVTVRPSTMVENQEMSWDGGFVLPGESLSRHRPEEQAPEAAAEAETDAETEAESEAGTGDIQETGVLADPDAVSETQTVPEAVVLEPENPPAEAVEPARKRGRRKAAGSAAKEAKDPEPAAAAETEVQPVPEVTAPEALEEAAEEMVQKEEEPEFEPEEGSASHRVDPSAPSEFRVSAPETGRAKEERDESAEEESKAAVEADPPTDAGDEKNVETGSGDGQKEEAADGESATGSAAEIFGYASGAGVLEEEEIDEEEYDFEHLHEAGVEEHDGDEMEEQILDQASQLGEFVREQHIERRLGYEDNGEGNGEEAGEEKAHAGTEEEDVVDEEGVETEDHEAEHGEEDAAASETAAPSRRGRRHDRRGGRNGRHGGRNGRHGGRRTPAQALNLPAINELLKQGQEILVQIAKEPIAKKGARITSHIALPGRFLVFMPTVNHVGVSRKISSDEERQRLKRILISEKGEASGGFIVRTAAEHANEAELRADIRFLINLWAEIKERSDNAKAPALIYHDLNLVERILRDQVSEQFSTIWVDSETDYERIVRFLNRVQPSLVRRVKLYTKEMPLFEQFGIQEEISKALKSKVWLKSGGSIVINQTEALVAIDINTGKYVGKTARLEDTILRTNLDAIPEIVRQIRLRDLGGIIVIDFIDMDERKNRHKVMQALEEELKNDRAPSKVLQFNDFGLVAITRKRVKQSLERTLSVPCPICTGTGMVKGPMTVANEIYIEMRKMQRHFDRNDVLLRVNPEVVKTLKANGARWLNELEEMIGKTIIVKSDPALHPEQFDIH